MWNPNAYFERLYEEALAGHLRVSRESGRAERKRQLKQTLRQAIGVFPENEPPFTPVLLERTDCGEYFRERVALSASPGLTFAAYVLIPKEAAGKLPAVLAIHGHGYGSREIVGLLPDGSPDPGAPGIHRHFALQLVSRGMAVIAPDVLGFGERRFSEEADKDPRKTSSCFRMATQLLLHGTTLTGLRTAEMLTAHDYIAGRDDIDPSRIGVMGFSGGGLLAFICAALDERLRAAVLAGFPNTFKSSIMAMSHCVDNYIPGLLRQAELPEWISLIAPRPLFLESGSSDRIFPVDGFRQAAADIRSYYEQEQAEEQLIIDEFEGGHEISGRRSFDWLKNILSV
ncbi:alpha/beta hydrolase family protein [Paenibacillus tarimensis]